MIRLSILLVWLTPGIGWADPAAMCEAPDAVSVEDAHQTLNTSMEWFAGCTEDSECVAVRGPCGWPEGATSERAACFEALASVAGSILDCAAYSGDWPPPVACVSGRCRPQY